MTRKKSSAKTAPKKSPPVKVDAPVVEKTDDGRVDATNPDEPFIDPDNLEGDIGASTEEEAARQAIIDEFLVVIGLAGKSVEEVKNFILEIRDMQAPVPGKSEEVDDLTLVGDQEGEVGQVGGFILDQVCEANPEYLRAHRSTMQMNIRELDKPGNKGLTIDEALDVFIQLIKANSELLKENNPHAQPLIAIQKLHETIKALTYGV